MSIHEIMGAVRKIAAMITLLLMSVSFNPLGPVAFAATVTHITDDHGAVIRVTVAAVAGKQYYKVRPGDSIYTIAAHECGGQSRDWTGIYAASRKAGLTAWNANDLWIGQELVVSCTFVPGMLGRAPHPYLVPLVRPQIMVSQAGTYRAPSRIRHPVTMYQPVLSGTYHGSGSMQQCIISRESGGNSQVMNSTGHYGLYQFSYSTWVGYGGSPASFGHASVAEQNQVFDNAVAARGYSDWIAYDGC